MLSDLNFPNARGITLRFRKNTSCAPKEDVQNLLGYLFGLTFPIILTLQNQPDCPVEFRATLRHSWQLLGGRIMLLSTP